MIQVRRSARSADRLHAAAGFLADFPAGTEVLVVGASRAAVDDLVRAVSARCAATFGLQRFTLTQLAARLAAPALTARGLGTCTRLGSEAVAARATFASLAEGSIGFFAPVARCPGFARTLAATVADLRGAGVDADSLTRPAPSLAPLATLLRRYDAELAAARLADRNILLRCAADAVEQTPVDALVGLPLLLLDVPIETGDERALITALCAAAPRVLATVPSGDDRTLAALAALGATEPAAAPESDRSSSLSRLQTFLFAKEEPAAGRMDDAVRFFSAPGEGRETVEIARWVLDEARAGVRFDQMVVFVRSPQTYSALLETAFRRAGIPAYFARGTHRPNPSGRAFLALLACASDGLSATRFAEYLSFGQVPDRAADGGPPDAGAAWTGPRDDAFGAAAEQAEAAAPTAPDDVAPEYALSAPWKWEELLIDAAVIGGAQRWARRLDGLAHQLELERAELRGEEPDAARLDAIEGELRSLDELRRFALPVIEQLASFPAGAAWSDWLAHLVALAPRVLRRPELVLQVLAELAPMGPVGPVGLDEVHEVLADRLSFLGDEPPKYRYGQVLVAAPEDARGRSFQVVFVPGLAERIFPQRPREDPLLLDGLRRQICADLATQAERIDRERLLLRLAIGAAEQRVYLSYPRVDVIEGRPRVTSFYGLDVARAILGKIPDVEAFERQAAATVGARLAWPAPPQPADAIDAAEHDLATLAELMRARPGSQLKGGAQYLLELNAHLARSLRTRYKRWDPDRKWSRFDGFVRVADTTREILATHRLTARPYSPSALQHFAACPYRFYLSAVQRLTPRRVITPLEQLDPATRGELAHRVQAAALRTLSAAGALPLTPAALGDAEKVLSDTLDTIAAEFFDNLAPAIPRIWHDEIAALRADLVHWLRHLADDAERWHPRHFEFGFGIARDATLDPDSRANHVVLDGGWQLRGSVDLVERRADGNALRVTDHKTGADRTREGLVVGGGETLQPVLYGMAVEAALALPVQEARLFFCTSRGGFVDRVVVLDERARMQGRQVLDTIDRAIAGGFLPPAPKAGACNYCDFHLVCGPHEEERARRKEPRELAELHALRIRP